MSIHDGYIFSVGYNIMLLLFFFSATLSSTIILRYFLYDVVKFHSLYILSDAAAAAVHHVYTRNDNLAQVPFACGPCVHAYLDDELTSSSLAIFSGASCLANDREPTD